MNTPLKLITSLLANLGANITRKQYTDKSPATFSSAFIFNAVTCLVAAICLFAVGGFGTASTFTIILGVAFGLVSAIQGMTNIAALQCGPMSYTSVIISFSTILTALSGKLFFNESIGFAQIIGIILMLISFVLAANSTDDQKQSNFKWLALCIISFFSCGGIGIMQKVHQSSEHKNELNSFLTIAFIVAALACFLAAAVVKRQEATDNAPTKANKKEAILMLLLMVISGVCVAANNNLNLYLSGVIPSAIFFPLVNGGGLVLITLTALIIFREKLSKKQWIGLVFGIASVIFLCNPFA